MIKISQELKVQFEALLAQKEIPKRLHSEYLKWLRYYLDFCHKYGFENSKKQGLSHFIKKIAGQKIDFPATKTRNSCDINIL
jgi:hypothetical protein